MSIRGDPRRGHIGESDDMRKQEDAADKLKWLVDHPDPRFMYFLDQYVAARNLGLTQKEAREVAQKLTLQHFNLSENTLTCLYTNNNIT